MLLFEQGKDIYNSVEDVPELLERSALQTAIQILRRHRDVYFSKKSNGDNLKPASVLIKTVAATIAKNAPSYYDPFQLLSFITTELKVYAELSTVDQIRFTQKYTNKNLITRNKGVWKLPNPVNVDDNLLDSWDENPLRAKAFFTWIAAVVDDFSTITTGDDFNFLITIENAFGNDFVRKSKLFEGYRSSQTPSLPREVSPAKPWRC